MKISRIPAVTFVIFFCCSLPVGMDGTSFAISSSGDLDDYYVEIFNQSPKPNVTKLPKERPEFKEDICAAILNSTYFVDGHGVHYIDPNDKIQSNPENESIFIHAAPPRFTKQFRYKERRVATRKGVFIDDLMFICTAWNSSGDIMEIYYVSREYRLRNMLTRFVFGYNESKQIVVLAVAEQPSHIAMSAGDDHWSSRLDEPEGTGHAICNLTTVQRTRLCAIVLHSYVDHRQHFNFPFWKEGIEPQCKKQRIKFPKEGREVTHWTIECKTWHAENGTSSSFYISSDVEPNKYFISHRVGEDDNVAVKHCYLPHFTIVSS